MDTKINFPALCIGRYSIDRLNYHEFVSGKKFMPIAFKRVSIIDKKGNCFEIEGVEQSGGISIIDSIRNFGILFKVKPKLKKPVYPISVEEFRNMIMSILKENPKMISNLQISTIEELDSYHRHIDLINLF